MSPPTASDSASVPAPVLSTPARFAWRGADLHDARRCRWWTPAFPLILETPDGPLTGVVRYLRTIRAHPAIMWRQAGPAATSRPGRTCLPGRGCTIALPRPDLPWAEAVRQAPRGTGRGVEPRDLPTAFRTALLADRTHAAVWPVVRRLWVEARAWQDVLDQHRLADGAERPGGARAEAPRSTEGPLLWVRSPDAPTTEGILLVMAQAPRAVRERLVRGLIPQAPAHTAPRSDDLPAPAAPPDPAPTRPRTARRVGPS
jgi:hypothetical protein